MKRAMRNISLMMAGLFTIFIIFGTIPAGASTGNTAAKRQVALATVYVTHAESIVKNASFSVDLARSSVKLADAQVKKVFAYGKTYYGAYHSLKKRLTAVTAKINRKAKSLADAKAAAEEAKKVAAADATVLNAEKLANPSMYDLMKDNTALLNAKMAAASASIAVSKLNKSSTNYKNYKARINIVSERLAKVERDKEEALLASIAENAVRAVEAAPLMSYNDIAKVYELQNTAISAIAKVRELNAAVSLTARLKVVADKAVALKAQLDAAIIEAGTPAKLVSASAVDGRITIVFNKKPISILSIVDFKLAKSINGVITNGIISGITIVNDTTAILSVPYISPEPYTDRAVFYNIQYGGGNPINTAAFVISKLPTPYVMNVSAADNKNILVAFSEAMDDNATDSRNYVIRDGNWNVAGAIASISKVSGQSNLYRLRLSSGLRGGAYTVVISNVISQNGIPIITASKSITIVEYIPALGVSVRTALTVAGRAAKPGTQNIQKVTINGSFTSIPEKQTLSIGIPNSSGQPEVNALTVYGGPAASTGAFLVSFSDGIISTAVNVPVTKGDTASIVGALIHSSLSSIAAINNVYEISDANGNVTIKARAAAADKNVSIIVYPISGLNPAGEISFQQTQVQAGVAPGMTAAGNIVLRVNNPVGSLTRTITLPITAGLNSAGVAAKIAAELNRYGDIINQYSIIASASTVLIQDQMLNQAVAQPALSILDAGTTLLAPASSIEIQAPYSGHGTLLAYLSGSCVTINLAPTDTTASLVAARVATALNSYSTVGSAYISSASGQVITITRRTIGYTNQSITLVNGTARIPQSKIVTSATGSEGTAGVNQVNTVTIVGVPVIGGALRITVKDGVINQAISVAVNAGDSLSVVAQKIFGQLANNATITSYYTVSLSDSKLIFTKRLPAAALSFGFLVQ